MSKHLLKVKEPNTQVRKSGEWILAKTQLENVAEVQGCGAEVVTGACGMRASGERPAGGQGRSCGLVHRRW